jgi:hypothetical protein
MKLLDQIAADFTRAQAQLARSIGDTGTWRDDQRAQLERSRLDPLQQAANAFSADLRHAIDVVANAERLLAK